MSWLPFYVSFHCRCRRRWITKLFAYWKRCFFCLVCSKFHFDPYILCTSMFLKFESLSFFFFFFFVFRGSSFVIWYKAFDSDKQDFFWSNWWLAIIVIVEKKMEKNWKLWIVIELITIQTSKTRYKDRFICFP